MRENIKNILLVLLVVFQLGVYSQEEEASFETAVEAVSVNYEGKTTLEVQEKEFVDSVWEAEKLKLRLQSDSLKINKQKSDTSLFGYGYSIEYNRGYVTFDYDSIHKIDTLRYLDNPPKAYCDTCKWKYWEGNYKQQNDYKKERGNNEDYARKLAEREARKRKHRNRGGSLDSVSMILMVILGIALALLLFYLFANPPVESQASAIRYDRELDPTEIPLSELEQQILNAKANEDYQLAVRLYFIWLMKELAEKQHIVWQKKKTNIHYLMELDNSIYYKGFSRMVNIYEHVWYGKFEIGKEDFNQIELEFQEFIKSIER